MRATTEVIVCEDIARGGEPMACGNCPECGSVVTTRQGITYWCSGCRDYVPAYSIASLPSLITDEQQGSGT